MITEKWRRPALVHDWLTGMRGGEKVLEALLEIFPEAPIHTLFHFPGSASPRLERQAIHTSSLQNAPGLRRHYRRYLPLFPTAIAELDLAGHDLILSSSHCVAKACLPPPGALHVCYCHTPMRYVWDQRDAYFPRGRGPLARLRQPILTALQAWDARTNDRVDHFIANSRFVQERIRRYYGRAAEVIHPPVDVDFFTPGEGASGAYCLAVSALAPYKRLEIAMAACQQAAIELRIVGTGPERERLARRSSTTRFLGRVEGEELRALYRGARCFVQPGVEDFGIAAAEALACGTPVAALDEGGVRDIIDHGVHGILYPAADDPAALADALDRIQKIRFNTLNLRNRAESFSADRFRALLVAFLEGLDL